MLILSCIQEYMFVTGIIHSENVTHMICTNKYTGTCAHGHYVIIVIGIKVETLYQMVNVYVNNRGYIMTCI
jgi:hypothetical protein